MHMNNNSDAPIIGHTHEHFRDAQRTNCKNSRPKQTLGLMRASRAGHARADVRISDQRDARAQAWGRRMYPLMLQLTVSRLPNRTLINHYNMQVFQSAQEKVPGTHPVNPSAQDSRDARIS